MAPWPTQLTTKAAHAAKRSRYLPTGKPNCMVVAVAVGGGGVCTLGAVLWFRQVRGGAGRGGATRGARRRNFFDPWLPPLVFNRYPRRSPREAAADSARAILCGRLLVELQQMPQMLQDWWRARAINRAR